MTKAAENADVASQIETMVSMPGIETLSDGTKVRIRKCPLKHLPDILRLVSRVFETLGFRDLNDKEAMDNMVEMTSDPVFLLQTFANMSDDILSVLSKLVEFPEGKGPLEEVDADDALQLAMAAWGLNKDFFLNKILPMLQRGGAVSA